MKPVIIFRQALVEGAGYLGRLLTEMDIPWMTVRIDQNDPLPAVVQDYSGLVLMGGPMSVNDDLPWMAPLMQLVRDAMQRDIPVLGHCLGGQLVSKALGAGVSSSPVREIGWGEVQVRPSAQARYWFGELMRFNAFHWHGETFSLPPDAEHLLSSEYCENQAYAIGKHLVFQCHMEMTEKMVKAWCAAGQDEIQATLDSPAVQAPDVMLQALPERIAQLNAVSRVVYQRWLDGLAV